MVRSLRIIQLDNWRQADARTIAEADLVIDHNGTLIKNRYGVIRKATQQELRDAVKVEGAIK